MNWSRFVKKSRRKRKHFYDLFSFKYMKTLFVDGFFFHFDIFLFYCFLFCLLFLSSKPSLNNQMHSEIDDRCFSVFFVEIQLKKENLKSVFWVPEFRCPNQYTCLPNGLDLSLNVAVVVVPFSQKLIFSIPLEIKTKCAVCIFCKFVRQFLDLAIFCSMSFSI